LTKIEVFPVPVRRLVSTSVWLRDEVIAWDASRVYGPLAEGLTQSTPTPMTGHRSFVRHIRCTHERKS
jgi:hypothetical protein